MKKQYKRSFAVIGLGVFGSTVATALAAMGDDVLGIDVDEGRLSLYADKLTQAVVADARDDAALKQAGVGNYDAAVVAIGENLEANILATMNVKLLGVPTVWVKAQSVTHHRILSRIGVDRVIHPERDMGAYIAETLHTPFVSDYISLGNEHYLVTIVLEEETEERAVGDFFPDTGSNEWHIMGLMKKNGTFRYAFDRETIMETGDRLIVLGTRAALKKMSARL